MKKITVILLILLFSQFNTIEWGLGIRESGVAVAYGYVLNHETQVYEYQCVTYNGVDEGTCDEYQYNLMVSLSQLFLNNI